MLKPLTRFIALILALSLIADPAAARAWHAWTHPETSRVQPRLSAQDVFTRQAFVEPVINHIRPAIDKTVFAESITEPLQQGVFISARAKPQARGWSFLRWASAAAITFGAVLTHAATVAAQTASAAAHTAAAAVNPINLVANETVTNIVQNVLTYEKGWGFWQVFKHSKIPMKHWSEATLRAFAEANPDVVRLVETKHGLEYRLLDVTGVNGNILNIPESLKDVIQPAINKVFDIPTPESLGIPMPSLDVPAPALHLPPIPDLSFWDVNGPYILMGLAVIAVGWGLFYLGRWLYARRAAQRTHTAAAAPAQPKVERAASAKPPISDEAVIDSVLDTGTRNGFKITRRPTIINFGDKMATPVQNGGSASAPETSIKGSVPPSTVLNTDQIRVESVEDPQAVAKKIETILGHEAAAAAANGEEVKVVVTPNGEILALTVIPKGRSEKARTFFVVPGYGGTPVANKLRGLLTAGSASQTSAPMPGKAGSAAPFNPSVPIIDTENDPALDVHSDGSQPRDSHTWRRLGSDKEGVPVPRKDPSQKNRRNNLYKYKGPSQSTTPPFILIRVKGTPKEVRKIIEEALGSAGVDAIEGVDPAYIHFVTLPNSEVPNNPPVISGLVVLPNPTLNAGNGAGPQESVIITAPGVDASDIENALDLYLDTVPGQAKNRRTRHVQAFDREDSKGFNNSLRRATHKKGTQGHRETTALVRIGKKTTQLTLKPLENPRTATEKIKKTIGTQAAAAAITAEQTAAAVTPNGEIVALAVIPTGRPTNTPIIFAAPGYRGTEVATKLRGLLTTGSGSHPQLGVKPLVQTPKEIQRIIEALGKKAAEAIQQAEKTTEIEVITAPSKKGPRIIALKLIPNNSHAGNGTAPEEPVIIAANDKDRSTVERILRLQLTDGSQPPSNALARVPSETPALSRLDKPVVAPSQPQTVPVSPRTDPVSKPAVTGTVGTAAPNLTSTPEVIVQPVKTQQEVEKIEEAPVTIASIEQDPTLTTDVKQESSPARRRSPIISRWALGAVGFAVIGVLVAYFWLGDIPMEHVTSVVTTTITLAVLIAVGALSRRLLKRTKSEVLDDLTPMPVEAQRPESASAPMEETAPRLENVRAERDLEPGPAQKTRRVIPLIPVPYDSHAGNSSDTAPKEPVQPIDGWQSSANALTVPLTFKPLENSPAAAEKITQTIGPGAAQAASNAIEIAAAVTSDGDIVALAVIPKGKSLKDPIIFTAPGYTGPKIRKSLILQLTDGSGSQPAVEPEPQPQVEQPASPASSDQSDESWRERAQEWFAIWNKSSAGTTKPAAAPPAAQAPATPPASNVQPPINLPIPVAPAPVISQDVNLGAIPGARPSGVAPAPVIVNAASPENGTAPKKPVIIVSDDEQLQDTAPAQPNKNGWAWLKWVAGIPVGIAARVEAILELVI